MPEYYVATYDYQLQEPADFCFQVGERILVIKKEGDLLTGIIGNRTGTFPCNYVKKVEGQVSYPDFINFLFFKKCAFKEKN